MTTLTVHTAETAPPDAAQIIDEVTARYGFLPNLMGVLAEAPATAGAYLALGDAIAKTSFTPTERHVIWFTVNAEHECHYCMAAHTAIAHMDKVAKDVIDTARAVDSYADPKLEALRHFTLLMVRERGWASTADIDAFLAAGYTKRNALEVLIFIAQKTISNYTNHIAETPVDAAFQPFGWQPSKKAAE